MDSQQARWTSEVRSPKLLEQLGQEDSGGSYRGIADVNIRSNPERCGRATTSILARGCAVGGIDPRSIHNSATQAGRRCYPGAATLANEMIDELIVGKWVRAKIERQKGVMGKLTVGKVVKVTIND